MDNSIFQPKTTRAKMKYPVKMLGEGEHGGVPYAAGDVVDAETARSMRYLLDNGAAEEATAEDVEAEAEETDGSDEQDDAQPDTHKTGTHAKAGVPKGTTDATGPDALKPIASDAAVAGNPNVVVRRR